MMASLTFYYSISPSQTLGPPSVLCRSLLQWNGTLAPWPVSMSSSAAKNRFLFRRKKTVWSRSYHYYFLYYYWQWRCCDSEEHERCVGESDRIVLPCQAGGRGGKTTLWNKWRGHKNGFTKAPLSLTSAQGQMFCCKTKTAKYAQSQVSSTREI